MFGLYVCRENAPGQRECDDAIEVLNGCIREVDQASLAAISQQLTPRDDISMEVRRMAKKGLWCPVVLVILCVIFCKNLKFKKI